MAESKCTGNCMACTIFQRQYCAAQLAFSNMKMLEQMQKMVSVIQEKVEALQNNEASLFDPIAQSGDGV